MQTNRIEPDPDKDLSLRERFETALETDEYDYKTRLVYADFLDDEGEDDEARRQRRVASAVESGDYQEGREFIQDAVDRMNAEAADYYDQDRFRMTVEHLMGELDKSYSKEYSGEVYFPFDTPDFIDTKFRERLWESYYAVRGLERPAGGDRWVSFRCGC